VSVSSSTIPTSATIWNTAGTYPITVQTASQLTGLLAVTAGGTGANNAAQAIANLGGASLSAANTFITGPQTIQTGPATNKGLIVKATSGQSVNLQEWQN